MVINKNSPDICQEKLTFADWLNESVRTVCLPILYIWMVSCLYTHTEPASVRCNSELRKTQTHCWRHSWLHRGGLSFPGPRMGHRPHKGPRCRRTMYWQLKDRYTNVPLSTSLFRHWLVIGLARYWFHYTSCLDKKKVLIYRIIWNIYSYMLVCCVLF